MSHVDHLLFIFRLFLFVREHGGQNRGVWVEAIQRIGDGKPGDSWCCDLVSLVLGLHYGGESPVVRTGNCDVLLADCVAKGLIVDEPAVGDLMFSLNSPTDAHHVSMVTAVEYATEGRLVGTIAGNTSSDGISSNGDRCAEHDPRPEPAAGKFAYARLPEAA